MIYNDEGEFVRIVITSCLGLIIKTLTWTSVKGSLGNKEGISKMLRETLRKDYIVLGGKHEKKISNKSHVDFF